MEGHIGVDESGKGDFFGPLVIAACYVGPEHLAELDGVQDSKKLTDLNALRLAGIIRRTCPHSVIVIMPEKYNELYEKFRNLNKLLAWGHARAIENVLETQPANLVISDQFAAGGAPVKAALFELGKKVEFRSFVRAEADIAVAAASILARAGFLQGL
ncbi:ribonuclease HIII, partial [bacterium]